MQEIIDYLISEIKQQHQWRLQAEDCGGDEAMESWDMKEERILSDIQNIKTHNSEYVPPTAKSCQNCRRDETDDAQYCVVCENFSQWKPA